MSRSTSTNPFSFSRQGRSGVPALTDKPAIPLPPKLPGATHFIRFVPYIDSRRHLYFETVTTFLNEGDSPIYIGRYKSKAKSHVGKVTFRSKVISRAHAKIWVETGGKFFIQDTSSSSGTFLNQVRLSLANIDSTPHEIKNGDILQFGVPYQDGKEDNFKAIKARIELGKDASIPVFQIEPFLLGPDKDQDTKDGVSPKPSDVSLATPVEWNFTNEQSDHPELSVIVPSGEDSQRQNSPWDANEETVIIGQSDSPENDGSILSVAGAGHHDRKTSYLEKVAESPAEGNVAGRTDVEEMNLAALRNRDSKRESSPLKSTVAALANGVSELSPDADSSHGTFDDTTTPVVNKDSNNQQRLIKDRSMTLSVSGNPGSSQIALDADQLADSICRSFALLNSRQQMQISSDNEVIVQTINKVLEVGHQLYEAMIRSMETAEKGNALADDAAESYAKLAMGSGAVENVTQCTSRLATQARTDAKATHSKFKGIRAALSQISRELASAAAAIEDERGNNTSSDINLDPLPDAELSELFSADAEFTPGVEKKAESNMATSKNQIEHSDVLAQLAQAKDDLEELGKHSGCLVDWWRVLNVSLQREMTRENWEAVGNRYAIYQTKMSEAQDYCHHLEFVQQCTIKTHVDGNMAECYRPPVVMAPRREARVRVEEDARCFDGCVIV